MKPFRAVIFDMDGVIVDSEPLHERAFREVFAELGEVAFRRLESAAIQSCKGMVRAVIALGGGAYVSEENRTSLREIGKSVWLDCPLEICLSRIAGVKTRPLLGDEDDMRALLARRCTAYAQADYSVLASERSPEELVNAITTLLRK